MKRCGLSASVVLVFMMLFGAVAPRPAMSAAQSTSHVLLDKVQVAWSAPWERDVDSGGVGGTYEQLWIDAPTGSVMVEVDVPAVPGEQLRDNFLAAFANEVPLQQVDQGSYDDMTYSVDLIPYPGAPVGAFTLVRETPDYSMMILLIASTDSFAEAIASAQAGVTVDGAALFSGVDGATMQQRLTSATSGQTGAGQPIPVQTPTPHTGLNPDTPVAPTPSGAGAVTPTSAAPATEATVPIVPNTAREEGSASSPVTLSSNGWTVAWTGDWVNEYVDPISTTLWSSSQRASFIVYHFDFVEPSAAAFSQSELEFLTGDDPTAPWAIESANEIVPGSRFHVVFSRTTNGEKLYSVYDVVVEGGLMTASILEAWDTEVMNALSTVQQTVTINGAPAMADVVLDFATPPASNDDFSYSLAPSGRVIEWTGQWAEMAIYYNSLSLRAATDKVPVFMAIDREIGDEPDVTAAEWVVEVYENGDPGWTTYKAVDLDSGLRLFVVMQSEDGTQFRFHEVDQTGALRKEQYMLVNSDALAEQIAWVQANVTVGGVMPFADVQTLAPELFGDVQVGPQTGAITQVTPAAPQTGGGDPQVTPTLAAQGGEATVPLRINALEENSLPSPVTVPSNGWTVAWSGGWYTEGNAEPENAIGLWSPTERARFVVYHFDWVDPSAQAFAQGEVEFLSSESLEPYTIESAVDVVPGSHYQAVFSRTTNGQKFYSVYDVVVHDDGTMTGSILEAWDSDVTGALASVQQNVTTNGTPALADFALNVEPPPAPRDDFSYSMFVSARVVEWTGSWSHLHVDSTMASLFGPLGEGPRFNVVDEYPRDPMTAAEWGASFSESNPGWTVYKALDLDNGQRLFVVMQNDADATYLFADVDQSGLLPLEQSIVVKNDVIVEQVAFVQANVTVDGQPVFVDIQTLVPELFGGASSDSPVHAVFGNGGMLPVG